MLVSFFLIFTLNHVKEINSFSSKHLGLKVLTNINNKNIQPTVKRLNDKFTNNLQSTIRHVRSGGQEQEQGTIENPQLKENGIDSGIIRRKLKILLPALAISLALTQKPLSAMAVTSNSILSSLKQTESVLPLVFLTCTLPPTILGFYKNEYIVSYGYGLAIFFTALVNLITIKKAPILSTVQLCHTLALMFYGIRLSLFLLYREISIPRFREFTENIESRAPPNKLKRLPFMLSCSVLYMCMSAPLFSGTVATTSNTMTLILQGLVGLTCGGFLLNAVGDFTKSYIKYKTKNQDELVTTGIFKYVRHPNYTGEQIAWTSNFLVSIATTVAACNNIGGTWLCTLKKVLTSKIVWASFFGWLGIEFVLMSATKALETRQKKAYGETEEYKAWIEKSWGGFY